MLFREILANVTYIGVEIFWEFLILTDVETIIYIVMQ